ncbi:MAG: hypothetical protein K2W96_10780 [Gemmataceae bacterium]|nr:hypothetical protein [Gemmataceae bacterium]
MLRRVLAAYLVLAMAVGPNLCCCSLLRLAAGVSPCLRPAEALPSCCQGEAEEPPPCCRHEPEGGPPAKDSGRGEAPRKGDCPCREGCSATALIDKAADPLELSPSSNLSVPAAAFPAAPPAPAPRPATRAAWDTSPPTAARDMLRLLSRLRC